MSARESIAPSPPSGVRSDKHSSAYVGHYNGIPAKDIAESIEACGGRYSIHYIQTAKPALVEKLAAQLAPTGHFLVTKGSIT